MAFDVGELFAGISLDDAKYQAGLRKARADGEDFERKGIKPKVDIDTTAAQSKLGRLGALIDQNATKLKNVGRDMTMYVTAPIVAAGTASIVLAGNLEQSQIAFETLLGSKTEADAFLETLEQFAKTTPFQFTDLVEQSKRLMAYGFTAEQILPVLTSVGDATAALGSGAEGIEIITRAIGQIQAKGRVQAEEMRQLAEAGVPAWQMLAESMHMSVQEVMKEVEQGRVSADAAITTILEGMDERYAGLMEKQSKTILGQFSNLMDELKITAAEFGLAMKPFIEPALGIFKGMLEVVSALPAPLKAVIGVLGGIAAVIGPSLWAIGRMSEGVRALKDLWGFFRPAKVAADTAAVSANTAAVEANTSARNKNALTPPVGSSGVLPGAIGTGTGGMGAGTATKSSGILGGMSAGTAALSIGTATISTTYTVIEAAGAFKKWWDAENRSQDAAVARAQSLGRLIGEWKAENAGQELPQHLKEALAQFNADFKLGLDDLEKGPLGLYFKSERNTAAANALNKAIDVYASGNEEAIQAHQESIHAEDAATAATDENTAALGGLTGAVSENTDALKHDAVMAAESLADVSRALGELGRAPTAEEFSKFHELGVAQMSATPFVPLPNADNKPLPWPRAAAKGADFVTNGPELLLVGDNPSGIEHVNVTPSEAGGKGDGGVVIDLRGAKFGPGITKRDVEDALTGSLVPRILDALAVS